MEKRNKKKLKLCLMTRCANLLRFRNGSKIKCSVSNFILLNLWSTSLLIWRQVDFRSTFNHLFYTETLLFLTNQECNNSSRTTCVHNQPFIRIWLHTVKHFQWILKLLGEGKKKNVLCGIIQIWCQLPQILVWFNRQLLLKLTVRDQHPLGQFRINA